MKILISTIIYYWLQLKVTAKISLWIGTALIFIVKWFRWIFEVSRPSFLEYSGGFIDRAYNWYVFNEDYILFVLLAIGIDWLLGCWRYVKLRQFDIKQNALGFFIKLTIAMLGTILFEAMQAIITHDSIIKEWIIIITRLLVFLYPARSAWKSMSIITDGQFPPKAWTDKAESFSKNLDLDELRGVKKEKRK